MSKIINEKPHTGRITHQVKQPGVIVVKVDGTTKLIISRLSKDLPEEARERLGIKGINKPYVGMSVTGGDDRFKTLIIAPVVCGTYQDVLQKAYANLQQTLVRPTTFSKRHHEEYRLPQSPDAAPASAR